MNYSRKVKNNPLRDWYHDLPVRKLADSRDAILKSCGISQAVFYRWIAGITPIPHTAQVIINQLAGVKIFPVAEPISLKETQEADKNA